MLKYLAIVALFVFSFPAQAQQPVKADDSNNPFDKLQFANGVTDTLTLRASYINNFGKLNEKNLATLGSIDKLYGLNIKQFRYEITFKIDGFPKEFYIPCKDSNLLNILTSKSVNVNHLILKCVAYRFFTIDGVINFFYIDKATLSDRSI